MARSETVAGVILAGGRSLRMGTDKAFLTLGGERLVDRAVARLAPQVAALAISAGADPSRFAFTALPVIPDPLPGAAGPLAGILAGLEWARALRPEPRSIVTASVDAPFLPPDFVARLAAAAGDSIAVAESGRRVHPVFALVPVSYAKDLASFLSSSQSRAVKDWLATQTVVQVDFTPSADGADPFFNVNTPADLVAARAFVPLPSPPA